MQRMTIVLRPASPLVAVCCHCNVAIADVENLIDAQDTPAMVRGDKSAHVVQLSIICQFTLNSCCRDKILSQR